MILRLAEVDDHIMEAYLEDEDADISAEDILVALRRGTHARKLVPVMCGSSLRGKGVEAVLDAIISFLPSPADRPPVKLAAANGKQTMAPYNGPSLCALAFKISYDKARGPVTFLRLFSGELNAKTVMHNSTKDIRERPNHVYEIKADELKVIESARSGDVVAVVGLKGTETGDTLVTFKGPLHGQRLAGLSIPPPVFALAIEPETSSEQAAMEEALRIMCIEDPSLQLENDKESGQTLLRGIGELHLEIVLDRLQREHNVSVITGRTYVSYRETIGEAYQGNFKFDRTLGGKRLFAGMTVTVTPKPEASLATPEIVVDKAAAASLTSEELDAVVNGFKDSMTRGPLAGYPIACLQVTVHAVEKDGDTTAGAIRACANSLVNHVINTSQPTILEPVMAVELSVPDQFVGSILNDVTARGGQIDEIGADSIPNRQLIQARIPLKSLLGYSTSLRSLTQGEGSFTMQYDRHSPVDPQSFQSVVAGNV
jgi:elongation factor G